MTLAEIIKKSRSCRRFHQNVPTPRETLKELVNLTRFCPSAANLQPLKYILSSDEGRNTLIFPHLAWAAYLKGWKGPEDGERPTAYIIVLQDTNISKVVDCDHGIACQTILLGATERGLGGCMIGAVERKALRKALAIADHLQILLVIALGKPKEVIVVDPVGPDGDIRYWRDEKTDTHHVPKRDLETLIVG